MRDPLPEDNGPPGGRSPALPIGAAFAAGIAADHLLPLPRIATFVAAAVLLGVLPLSARKARRGLRVVALLTLFACLGAAAHHAAWSDRGPASVLRIVGTQPRLATLTGTVETWPEIDRRRDRGQTAAWAVEDRTRCDLAVDGLQGGTGEPLRLDGRVRLRAAGHLVHVGAGDRVEVVGWLLRPEPPRNPGGFDAAAYFRRQGIDAILTCDHPDAVRRLAVAPASDWRRVTGRLRDRLAAVFAERLSEPNAAVGAAMLLGDRSAVPDDLRDVYLETGAMHVLAISGLHVGILALLLAVLCRLLGLRTAATAACVVTIVVLYALLTGLRPPVVRATTFIALWAAATLLFRRATLLNVAAVTATGLLLWNPLLLLDGGAQLSFLAVFGMSWTERLGVMRPLDRKGGIVRRLLGRMGRFQVMSAGIWAFTAPAIAALFGIVSPVGLLLNVLLIPLTTLVLWSGFVFLGVAAIAPAACGPFAVAFDYGLSAMNAVVSLAGAIGVGHARVASPAAWWLGGGYALLGASLVRPDLLSRRLRWGTLLLLWVGAGLTAGGGRSPNDELRCTVLSVGHGGAVLTETPSGRTLLFDCGAMQDSRLAADAAWAAVRSRGGTRIDAALLSHADLDHCNNVAALLDGGPVGVVLVPRSFLDLDQRVVRETCDAARAAGVPMRLVARGDRLRLDPAAEFEIVHPPDRRPDGDDNGNSAVCRIRYAGRTLLLTGDLEGRGQWELFAAEPPGRIDFLVAPHHGGARANTAEIADWARPGVVVASSGQAVNLGRLGQAYPNARVYATSRDAAVIAVVGSDGRFAVEPMRP